MMAQSPSPTIVLLHGCGGSPEAEWEANGWPAAIAAIGRRALFVRLPGHGRDGPSHDPADYADLAGMVLNGLPRGPVDIIGFSLGAKIALALALRSPDSVRRMVLGGIGDNIFAPESFGEAAAHALEHGPIEQTPPPVLAFLETWDPGLNDPAAIAAVLRRPANPLFSVEDIGSIATPVLVANGADDIVGQIGTRLFDGLGLDQILIPGVGHFDLTAHPDFRRLALGRLQA